MTGRILAAALVMTLLPLNLANGQTTSTASPGKFRESIAREVAKQIDSNRVRLRRPPPRARGPAKQHIFAAIGAVAGMVAGAYIGAEIDGDRCSCDDPGLTGFIIGAPIGAIVGGVVGFKLGK